MKLVQINSVCNGSTGKIMGEIQKYAMNAGLETLSVFGRNKQYIDKPTYKCSNKLDFYFHVLLTFLFNNHGMYSYFKTKKLIKKLKDYNPDIIQLHNIHGYYLNYKLLFNYLKNDFKGKVFWTLHDCWSFTGHCAHFTYIKCPKWQSSCHNCPQVKEYPISLFFDTSKSEYNRKKELFNGVDNLTIITPSEWLAKLVKKSYLDYPVEVICNGIDLNTFKYTYDKSILKKYSIDNNKKTILGIANVWGERKGLKDFIKLSKDIDSKTQIVLVGLDKKQISNLPDNIIGIERTDNQMDLVKIYSAADVFVNPTLEDNYPTVNIEAIACGTPIITYDTGGCKEQIFPNTGFCVKNYKELCERIKQCLKEDYKHNKFNLGNNYKKLDSTIKYKEYIELYSRK